MGDKIKYVIIFLLLSLANTANIYVALQMLDEIGIVDSESMNLINSIEIDLLNSSDNITWLI